MSLASISTFQSNLIKSKSPGTPLNQELIANRLFNSYTLASNAAFQVTPTIPTRSTFIWAILNCSVVSGPANYAQLCNSSGGTAYGVMGQSPSTAGLATGGGSYYYMGFQQYLTNQTNTCTQTISNMSVGTYAFSIWAIPRSTNYFNTQSLNVSIGGTQVISPKTFTSSATNTPWSNFTGTYTISAGNEGNKVLSINFVNTSSVNDSTIFISTISLKRTA